MYYRGRTLENRYPPCVDIYDHNYKSTTDCGKRVPSVMDVYYQVLHLKTPEFILQILFKGKDLVKELVFGFRNWIKFLDSRNLI